MESVDEILEKCDSTLKKPPLLSLPKKGLPISISSAMLPPPPLDEALAYNDQIYNSKADNSIDLLANPKNTKKSLIKLEKCAN